PNNITKWLGCWCDAMIIVTKNSDHDELYFKWNGCFVRFIRILDFSTNSIFFARMSRLWESHSRLQSILELLPKWREDREPCEE
ncbi:hypothetical protein PFISCL1PPCAC_5670, partial [Pristionchus fissidentatus]